MALTRAQLLAGNDLQGDVLLGQVQGVTAGSGVQISNTGVLSLNGSDPTFNGFIKANNINAYNAYVWPQFPGTNGQQLTIDGSGNLTWKDADGIPWTAKGQLIVGTGVNTDAILNSGSDTSILVANSATATGLSYSNSITSAILLAAGTTAQRPTAPVAGQLRFNTTNKDVEVYDGNAWDPLVAQQDLLVGTYHLYVDSEIGNDVYVTGIYDSTTTPVITNQQITSGYTPQTPFKTLARAALEVARITGPGTGFDPNFYDRIVIHVAAGDIIVDNIPGGAVAAWTDGMVPTSSQLAAFNAPSGGLILPRGVSVIGEDLRKTVIRPTFVPAVTGNQDTDRTAILRVTGGSYFFNFTFKDKLGSTQSHHLVDCFQFISQADLQSYYNKVQVAFAFGTVETPANPGETEITAPQPPTNPTTATDGVIGSSPYIFNCSIRSLYGLCGIQADGSVPTGFKSMVVAQFTGVSLQKDLACWQRYDTGLKTWTTFASYNQLISEDPNNVRMNPARLSAHIRTRNGGVVQAVSVFAIGQGVHHWAQSGSDVTITNSNSNFGGVAGLAEGYKTTSFQTDVDWRTEFIRVPTNLTDNTNNVSRIYLGTVQSVTATTITLTAALEDSVVNPGQPSVVGNKGYTLPAGSLVWVENPSGNDWYSGFANPGWSIATPANLSVTTALINQNGNSPGVGVGSLAIGKRVYIRRLLDVRTPQERRYSLVLTNPNTVSRNPLADYIVQTQIGGSGISSNFPTSQAMGIMASTALNPTSYGTTNATEITISRRNTPDPWVTGGYYRPGDTVTRENKHWLCRKQTSATTFILDEWDESYVHMADTYYPPDAPKNTSPIIIFDNDTDPVDQSTTLGYNLTTVWSTNPDIIEQYRSSTDFKGLQLFLIGLGFTTAQANTILTPVPKANRDLNPAAPLYGLPAPSGAANNWANWAVQFRRPTNIRMFGHAWEWSGFLNYTKALPPYQGDLSSANKFTYYFTNANGGVVYASGFNEEGQVVTPSGVTNISTGETIAVENIGTGSLDLPTTFNNLTLTGNTTIQDNLDLSVSSINWGPATYATTTQFGVVELATDAEAAAGLSTSLVPTVSNSVPKDAAGMTGAALLPGGTTTQRPVTPVSGMTRFNSTNAEFEGYNGNNSVWQYFSSMPTGPAVASGTVDKIFYQNALTVTEDYTTPTTANSMSAGPIAITVGKTVTIPAGSVWTIV